MSCHHGTHSPTTRRELLSRCALGFGSVALTSLLGERAFGNLVSDTSPLSPKPPHFAPKVKRVIYLYMDGAPSQVDTFDPKPRLDREHGKPFGMTIQPTQFNNIGKTLKSPWKFKRGGESGIPVSDLFPKVREHVDDLCVVRSMVSEFSEHTNANYFLHTGLGLSGRPSMGAWVTYGLGSENENLPGYAVINGGLTPPGGLDCFASGFLPATYQGSMFQPQKIPVANIRPGERTPELQRSKLDLLGALDKGLLAQMGPLDALESSIANQELAFRMQAAVPELSDLSDETEATKSMYGVDSPYKQTQVYARQCLLARRMIERGVRFIELTCPHIGGADRWDQHGNLKRDHENNARAVDQPIAALLTDLKRTGLFEETLVIWSGEFGRTPFAQGANGRDHNPYGFSLWMAGGGIKGGMTYGATDEYGYHAVDKRVEIYDLHATMLHLLGFDHTQLTFRHSGRDMRLTDVHGKVVTGVLA